MRRAVLNQTVLILMTIMRFEREREIERASKSERTLLYRDVRSDLLGPGCAPKYCRGWRRRLQFKITGSRSKLH